MTEEQLLNRLTALMLEAPSEVRPKLVARALFEGFTWAEHDHVNGRYWADIHHRLCTMGSTKRPEKDQNRYVSGCWDEIWGEK